MRRLVLPLIMLFILSYTVSAVEYGSFRLSIGAPTEMQKFIGEKAGEYNTDFYLNDSAFTFENKSISGPGYWKEPEGDIALFFSTGSRIVDEDDLALTEGGYTGKSTTAYDKQFWEQRNVYAFGNIDICKERKDYPAQASVVRVKEGKIYCIRWGAGFMENHAMIKINKTEIKEGGGYATYNVDFDYIYAEFVAPPPEPEPPEIIEKVVEDIVDETEDIMSDMEENLTSEEENITNDMMVDAFEEPEPEMYEEEFVEPAPPVQKDFIEENKMLLIGAGVVVVLIVFALLLLLMKKKHEGNQPPQQPGQPPQQPQQPPQYQQQPGQYQQPVQQPGQQQYQQQQQQYQQPAQPQQPQQPGVNP